MIFEIPLTYRNVLPRLWYLMLIKDIYDGRKSLPFGGRNKDQLQWILSKMGDLSDDGAQKLQKNFCSYCGDQYSFDGKGDHIVNKEIYKKYKELDMINFRLTCCGTCNPSKGKKDFIDWWINYKGKNITDKPITKNHLNLYSRAMWIYLKGEGRLDEEVPEEFKTTIQQLHNNISEPSYDEIWKSNNSNPEQTTLF